MGEVPHSPQSSALKTAEKVSKRFKLNDEVPISHCTAGECCSVKRPFGKLSAHGNRITSVMPKGGQSFPWGTGKDLFPFPPGWLPSLAWDSGSSQAETTPSSSRAAGLQPMASDTQHLKLNQLIFKSSYYLGYYNSFYVHRFCPLLFLKSSGWQIPG